MIPLFIDCATKRIVIFGGGEVAARKAAFFAWRADVCVVSRSHSEKIATLPVILQVMDVKKVPDAELESFLDGAFIVIAALSEKSQNNRIGRICKRKNILFNNASGERGDLIIPAVSSGKRYMVAVSTEGRSPAVSRFIREHIGATFSRLDDMILLQDAVRTDLKKTKIPQQRRSAILSSMLRDPEIWDALECSLAEAEKSVRRKYIHA